ncbi:MAG: hypothetical protein CL846_05520 [Crocinitomicaceae bacterium]|nr:hypothetical protein [Crocinitomicaceae bacterium]
MDDLKFQLPIGYYFLFLALAVALSFLLYNKEIKRKSSPGFIVKLLISLRFIFLSLLFLFLFEPIIYQSFRKQEKPILVFAQDNSESILNNKDSLFIKSSYKDSISILIDDLKKKFDVVSFSFGQEVNENNIYDFGESSTNSEMFFNIIKNRFYGKNLTDIIIASDGIINNGNNPKYNSLDSMITIHTVGLGDTNISGDISIKNINTNQYSLLGNSFPVEIVLKAVKVKGKNTTVFVYNDKQLIKELKVDITESNQIIKLNFDIPTKEKGLQEYNVKVKSIDEENNLYNNQKSFSIDVIDKTQNILILAKAPHPDLGALNWALSDQLKTSVNIEYIDDFDKGFLDYDLVIFHKGLNFEKTINSINTCKRLSIPILIFTGNNINHIIENNNILDLKHNGFKGQANVSPYLNPDFNSFNMGNNWNDIINNYPPLNIPFSSNYLPSASSKVFLYQFQNGIKLNYPLAYFIQKQDYKLGVFLGEGIWRWRINEFKTHGNSNVFKKIFQKTAQLLKVIDKKERLKIILPKIIKENEPFYIQGEVYNSNLELNNEEELSFKFKSDDGQLFQKVMKPTNNYYELPLKNLSKGTYSYIADVEIDDDKLINEGVFKVEKSYKELMNKNANHELLKLLSNNNNGKFVLPNQFHILKNHLLHKINRESIYHEESTLRDLIHWKWLILILIFPFVEWLLRKKYGMI